MINIEISIFSPYFARGLMGAALYVALSQEDRDGAAKDRILNWVTFSRFGMEVHMDCENKLQKNKKYKSTH